MEQNKNRTYMRSAVLFIDGCASSASTYVDTGADCWMCSLQTCVSKWKADVTGNTFQ
jgi:hypothetical protein